VGFFGLWRNETHLMTKSRNTKQYMYV